jgi:CRISPR-associated endonuclease/helicase Cas3
MGQDYIARFLKEKGSVRRQALREHLLMVAKLASAFASQAKPNDEGFIRAARLAGLLHDLGKYKPAFQQRLRDAEAGRHAARVPHAIYGAAALGLESWDQSLAVLGHHSGLHAVRELKHSFTAAEMQTARQCLEAAGDDGLKLLDRIAANPPHVPECEAVELELRQRFLFSCLIDADRSDCVRFETKALPKGTTLDPAAMLEKLLVFIDAKAAACPPGTVKDCRKRILDACLEAAGQDKRLFTLPVPTGGGKTLSGMAFALKHAALHPDTIRRVIVVVPYLSIIEQNAAEYRKALGDACILEHHSGTFCGLQATRRKVDKAQTISENEGDEAFVPQEEDEDAQMEGGRHGIELNLENWDAPVIITTSVRFFETLFSNRPADLRRLHNIARSVVILDEVQTLPPHVLQPILSVMEDLSKNWKVHFVFSTATQPAFERTPAKDDGWEPREDTRWEPGTLTSIIAADLQEELTKKLCRVAEPTWPKKDEKWSLEGQAEAVLAESRVLCILNTKKQVRELYERLKEGADGMLVHLSTRMCAEHRLKVIQSIRDFLDESDAPCRVISSQLVEAGVDLSFPVVMRALGPFDSIVQAAGRCDRHGKLSQAAGKPAGRLILFEPEEGGNPYPHPTGITKTLSAAAPLSIHSPEDVQRYFDALYEGNLDGNGIQALRSKLKFPEVNDAFSLIDDRTRSVLVPYGEGKSVIDQLQQEDTPTRELLRRAMRSQVGLYPNEFNEAVQLGSIYPLDATERFWACRSSCYDDDLGLVLRGPDAADYIVE